MGKYSWPIRSLTTSRLKLDVENPRLPDDLIGNASQKEIIDYLVKNEKVYDIAESISSKGYLHNEMPYVYKNDKGHFIVLEGNRRVTACKLLLDPKLAPNTRQRSFKVLSESIDKDEISKVQVILCPSRDEADVLIESRHTNNLLESWDAIKKARFYYRKIKKGQTIEELQDKFASTNIKKLLMQYFMYEEAQKMDFDNQTLEKIRDEKKFKITNFERFYDKKSGRDFLGIEFKKDGTFTRHIPEEEFNKRFKYIVQEVLNGQINSRKLNTVNELNEYVKNLFNTGKFDISIKPSKDINVDVNKIEIEQGEEKEGGGKKPSQSKPPKKSIQSLIPKDFEMNIENQRIIDVFDELQNKLKFNSPNSIAFSFRSFLEMVCYQFLLKKDLIKEIVSERAQKNLKESEVKRNKISAYLKQSYNTDLDFTDNKLIKVLEVSPKRADSSPNLWAMLTYITKNGINFINDPKLWNTLSNYLKNKDDENFITHQGFNDLTHSEYKPSPKKAELIKTWETLFPLINYMIKELDSWAVALSMLIDGYVNDIIINDYDRSIYAFWFSVLNESENFCRLITDTPISIEEWRKQKNIQKNKNEVGLLELGFSTFYLNRTNRSGIIKAGVIGGIEQKGEWKMDVRFNKKDLLKRIEKIIDYKSKISLHNLDTIDLIDVINKNEEISMDNSFMYLDPPYYVKGKDLYVNFYTHQDHLDLANKITSIDGFKWLLSYDNNIEIINLYKNYKKITYNLTYSVEKKYQGSEVVIYSDSLSLPIKKILLKNFSRINRRKASSAKVPTLI